MFASPRGFRFGIVILLSVGAVVLPAFAGPVAPPVFSPNGGPAAAPLQVTIRCATPDAAIHITVDGTEPKAGDTEVESGASVLIDEPLTLKAKAFLSAKETSATTTAIYALTPVAGSGSTFVEQGVTATMAAGLPCEISVVFRNIGGKPWTSPRVILVPARARDSAVWNVAQVALKEAVPTWKTGSFAFPVTAPAAPGTYNMSWQLQDVGGETFGEATALLRAVVVPPGEIAKVSETSAPVAGAAGGVVIGSPTAVRAANEKPAALPEGIARLKVKYSVTAGSATDRVVQVIAGSPHSFRALRERGLSQTDAEFAQVIAANPGLFKSVRIVRRDEQGRRVIPGWPGIDLNLTRPKR